MPFVSCLSSRRWLGLLVWLGLLLSCLLLSCVPKQQKRDLRSYPAPIPCVEAFDLKKRVLRVCSSKKRPMWELVYDPKKKLWRFSMWHYNSGALRSRGFLVLLEKKRRKNSTRHPNTTFFWQVQGVASIRSDAGKRQKDHLYMRFGGRGVVKAWREDGRVSAIFTFDEAGHLLRIKRL